LGIAIVAAALLVVNALVFHRAFKEDYERFRAVKLGMNETEVIALLGKPYKTYDKATAPKSYYVEGYTFKERSITNKVFIYIGTEPIAYIYFDDKNRVEDTFVGGS
jgi:outer membrane protein assembly factor BamE (lipoprotein component of BamABCDE complex)